MQMRHSGVVKFFNDDKGFGFIKRDDGGTDLFVHISALRKTSLDTLPRDAKVSFEVEDNARGQRAVAVQLVP
jgi:cold shock protein